MRLIIFKFLSWTALILISACAVQDKGQSDLADAYDTPATGQKLQGVFIPDKIWDLVEIPLIKKKIKQIVEYSLKNEVDLILFEIPNNLSNVVYKKEAGSEEDFNPLKWIIREAHKNGIVIYASVDPFTATNISGFTNVPTASGPFIDISDPDIKTVFKNTFTHLTNEYNLDGIHIIIPPGFFSSNNNFFKKNKDYSAFTDFIENILVSSMLIKPYLVNSISINAEIISSIPEILDLLEKNIIDFLVPVIKPDTDLGDINEYITKIENSEFNNYSAYIFPGLKINPFADDISRRQFPDKLHGLIYYPEEINDNTLYPFFNNSDSIKTEEVPIYLKRTNPDQVVGLDLSKIITREAFIDSIFLVNPGKKLKIPDSENWIGIILQNKPDSLNIIQTEDSLWISTLFWKIPFDYIISGDKEVEREKPWLEFRQFPDRITENEEFHLLCKTEYPATAWIETDTVKVYKTGIFFNKIQLKKGTNRIIAGVIMPDSTKAIYAHEFSYREPINQYPEDKLWIDDQSISPDTEMLLLPEDKIQINFKGSTGKSGYISDKNGGKRIKCSREDFNDYSIYSASLLAENWEKGVWHNPVLILGEEKENLPNPILTKPAKITFKIMLPEQFPFVRTTRDNVRLTYTMGQVRLGGPIRAELPEGIILKTDGKIGDQYRIYLNELETGYVDESEVQILSDVYTREPYYISSLSCGPGDNEDVLTIPYSNKIPYAIYPEPEQKRIRIKLYGARTSSTWISHRKGRKIINNITWTQPTPETYEVIINLNYSRIWGYSLKREQSSLVFRIKYPPDISSKPDQPLLGLKIAIEAGHGGSSFGAMGLSGLFEKDINLDLAQKVEKICKGKGAEVIQVREMDTTMSLIDKRKTAINSGADLLISIHANAAGTRRGFLRVGGTSTYYNNPFWSEFAEVMYNHLLELDLDEFCVVGSFNYTVIRVSEMPSILVEQAFMTHAEDEEKLADDVFRRKMAEKISEGVEEYLKLFEE